jgi:hypothetical protein
MGILHLAMYAPIFAALVAAFAALIASESAVPRPPARVLVVRSVLYAGLGAAVSLAATIAWMVWYERTSGQSAGDAPIGWILFYGPLSAASGQIVALISWWIQKPAPPRVK